MAAYATVISLLNTIEQMMTHPRLYTSFHKNQIQSLQKKVILLLDFIEGGYNNNYGGVSEEAGDLESLIATAAQTAEDMIESHIANQILGRSTDHGRETALSFSLYLHRKMAIEEKYTPAAHTTQDMIETTSSFSKYVHKKMTHMKKKMPLLYRKKSNQTSLSCSEYLQHIIEDMDAIIQKANEFKDKQSLREEQHSTTPLRLETGEETAAMMGFDDELIQLLDELTSQRSNRHIISIVGMGGMGKTTLAKTIYANQLILERFDIRAWAIVSQQYNAKEILEQLVFGQGKSSGRTVDELGEQLHRTLFGRRYLIMLDDIWSVEAWDEVKHFFPDNGNGSRIVLTTRLSNVASDCGSSCFQKNLLDENGSWELFCRKAFQREDCPTELEEVGKKIVKLCKGLPLSIVVIGGRLLKSPRTVRYWENVAGDIESFPNSKEKEESLDVLFSSYNHLPPHLKPCFLHIGVLKSIKYGRFHIARIIQLWVAEGFVKPNGGRVLEEIAEDYLKDLISRNMILVDKRSKNGKMKSCDIHDLLRDLCLKVAEQQGFFHVITQGRVLGTERRLIYDNTMWVRGTARPPLARSIVDYRFRNEESNNHRLLKTLHVHYHRSAEESFGCVNLRYLALEKAIGMDVLKLPRSISSIWNLHALIIQIYSSNNLIVVAPLEIWRMLQLRHIECCQIYLPFPNPPSGLLILENFQTLENAVNLRLSEDMCKIIPNIKRLHLVYDRRLQGYYDYLIVCLCNLGQLHKLESLKLIADDEWWRHNKLSEILTFPSSLNKLSLRHCGLHWDDLIIIGSLPQLEVLKLDYKSVTKGSKWNLVDGKFQRLKFLRIDCCDLRCWNAESCHFPVLEKLVFRRLRELEEIPWGIGEIPTLEIIYMNGCSKSALISGLKIKDNQLEYMGNDDLHIQVDVDRDELESFMEMVETEGFTLNNVQLNIRDY